jgi:protein CWC15
LEYQFDDYWNSEEEDSDEEEEDDTAELLRELEKIKRERAEEKARLENEQSASDAASREAEIATANPLLNLAAALGQAPGVNTTVPGSFQVKKRWDDGIFHSLTYPVISSRTHIFVSRSYFQESSYGPKI